MNPAYIEQMENQLGTEEAELYFASLDKDYVRGIRVNPRKKQYPSREDLDGRVPWGGESAYYLKNESTAGSVPLHEAGAWYIQEPSAMASVAVLNPSPGERILDLCAAPGGKSTQIADALQGQGLLVCNEPVLSRAKILSHNLERMGIGNALVVNAMPAKLSSLWEAAFDAVLVDAPCSGEGMFRRHPETIDEWTPASPAGCAQRQLSILEEACRMVRPGGRMVYSTCTFNHEEDEGVVLAFLAAHPQWRSQSFSLEGVGEAPRGMMHLYPHKVRGEGHFVALLMKEGAGEAAPLLADPGERLGRPGKDALSAYDLFAKGRNLPQPNAAMGDYLLWAPMLPPLQGIKVLRAGVQLGYCKGKVWEPDHALALFLEEPYPFPAIELSEADAGKYQAGESLNVSSSLHGWVLPTFSGLALGFGKVSDGVMKNHYPKGLRKPQV